MARQRVVVVTGSAVGIGAAIAEELGRTGAFVVTLDPSVTVDGSTRMEASGPTTAERIVAAGGSARASNASVTDAEAVRSLFSSLADELGSLDAVVNVAGISRATGFGSGQESDWAAVLDVHVNGYLNVLRAALPIMGAQGHGRILGVTSGSGWRPANAGAYSAAKRAVAALTWQLGRIAPAGVTVNALSPIALTRMVTGAATRPAGSESSGANPSATGGLSLAFAAMPPPENLGPIGAYLASDEFSWSSGHVMFSSGSEIALVDAPQLLEVTRTVDVKSLAHALDAIVPSAFLPAEAAQLTNGGSNPRFPGLFDESGPSGEAPTARAGVAAVRSCLVITDDAEWRSALHGALGARAITAIDGSAEIGTGFEAVAHELAGAAERAGSIDAVVVALMHDGGSGSDGAAAAGENSWPEVLEDHAGITERIRTDVAWLNAVASYASTTQRPVRVVIATNAASAAGRTRAQAAAQLSRAAHPATEDRVSAYSISVGTPAGGRQPAVELVAHLLHSEAASALSGAELVVGEEWIGLCRHPSPRATVVYGGPSIPDWLDGVLRRITKG